MEVLHTSLSNIRRSAVDQHPAACNMEPHYMPLDGERHRYSDGGQTTHTHLPSAPDKQLKPSGQKPPPRTPPDRRLDRNNQHRAPLRHHSATSHASRGSDQAPAAPVNRRLADEHHAGPPSGSIPTYVEGNRGNAKRRASPRVPLGRTPRGPAAPSRARIAPTTSRRTMDVVQRC